MSRSANAAQPQQAAVPVSRRQAWPTGRLIEQADDDCDVVLLAASIDEAKLLSRLPRSA